MFRLVLLSCLLSGILLKEAKALASGSDHGGSHLSDGRYYLYRRETDWFEAIANCFLEGQRLATFKSNAEYDQLIRLINLTDKDDTSNYWVAGSDLSRTNAYVWITTGNSVTNTHWYEGEPNHQTVNGEVEHCIELRYKMNFKMNDAPCSRLNYFICE